METPNWYFTIEIPLKSFMNMKNIEKLYDIREGRHESISGVDYFASECYMIAFGVSVLEYEQKVKAAQQLRTWSMVWGDFHQEVIGLLPEWTSLGRGHETKCDNQKNDGTHVVELKNNKATMNSDSQKSVMDKLKKQMDLGKRSTLVIMNGEASVTVKHGIEVMSGREFYGEITGRATFIDDLLKTMKNIFTVYPTYKELKAGIP